MAKQINLRSAADKDLRQAAAYYRIEDGPALALRFVTAVEGTFARLREYPHLGSPKYAELLNIPNLRALFVKDFPYAVFYVERPESLDVWRILHTRRDIPTTLRQSERISDS